ncbi:MAG: winged helix-turn-helix transcriptional regulator [Rhodobacter sp.]|nr:winged helix-turn-helix transcriptional regulator [Paracoccaceae bacterium]MCB1408333.1 winged helix-turn-helix transcriptional regulator [Paracoccaceae bacterium]MCC0078605.1 winged helix-turn-helix transcriptional regulator [Rhodobacter sp.]
MAPDGQNAEGRRGSQAADRSCAPYAVDPETLAAEAREASDFLKALGHEGRLLMLYHLCERDHTVTELEQLIMSRQAAVSQQLARLRHEKLVTTRRDGNQIIYSLADPKVREMIAVIQRLFRGA